MSHLQVNQRTYLKDRELYGTKVRSLLGLSNSAVVVSDTGARIGYVGEQAKADLIKADTHTNGYGTIEDVPTDVRTVGIAMLTALGIPEETQVSMFQAFMLRSKSEREAFILQWDALDKNNTEAVSQFTQSMVTLLTSP